MIKKNAAFNHKIVEVNSLTKYFGDFKALDNLSFDIAKGEVLVILGENGAGKTTTLRCLAGILKPSQGSVIIDGIDVEDDPEMVREQVGMLSELPGLYDRMTPVDYLDFFGKAYGLDENVRREKTLELLEMFGLEQRLDVWLGNFSKGMRQKVALIRAVLHQPKLILLDEPTSSMDPAGAKLTWNYIHNLKLTGLSIVVCTHNLRETAQVADEIAIMAKGKILRRGTLTELQKGLGLKPRYVKTLVPGLEDIYIKTM